MRIIFLGTSAAMPTEYRGLSSVAIVRNGELLLFDAGEGMQRNFIKSRIGMNRKTKIFITHLHADHCVGLLGLLQTMSLQGRDREIDIYGQNKLAEFIKENMRIINFGLTFNINIHVIEGEGVVVAEKDYQVSCCNSDHSVSALSFCIHEYPRPGKFNIEEAKRLGVPEGRLYQTLQAGGDVEVNGKLVRSNQVLGPKRLGRKIGISGDTRPSDKLEKFFHGCDILIFEATFGQDKVEKAIASFHSTAEEAAALAKNAGVEKLVLTHFSARYNDTSEILRQAASIHNDVLAAEDLLEIEVPYRDRPNMKSQFQNL